MLGRWPLLTRPPVREACVVSLDARVPADLSTPEHVKILDAAACYELLATDSVGRVVFTDKGLPAVLPVNYVLQGHRIVFRTAAGSRLAAAVTGQVVAFEVDQLDRESRIGWSVVATGSAHPLHESE